MKKLKWIVIGLVVLLGFTYGTYAMSYQGNYNVSVAVPVHVAAVNQGSAWIYHPSAITADSTPTTMWQFWSSLSVAGEGRLYTYEVYCELTSTGGVSTQHQSFDTTVFEDRTFTFDFQNIEPGQGNVHIYIMDRTTDTQVSSYNIPVVIG
jgi:hypothetical protein